MKRRGFLKSTGLVAASMMVPEFVKASAERFLGQQASGKKLVIIQLSGGNDGLNTVVPFLNDEYYKLRPQIGLSKESCLQITDEVGLNPGMSGLRRLYDEGLLTIINSVGYPNPNRSHFRSTDIWHSGSGSSEFLSTGWIGRFLDNQCAGTAFPHYAIQMDAGLSLALKGATQSGLSLSDPSKLLEAVSHPYIQHSVDKTDHHEHGQLAYLKKTLCDVSSSAEYVAEQMKLYTPAIMYPASRFGQRLQSIGQLINSGSETQVYYTSLSGFDTHANQVGSHENLLNRWSEGVLALTEDLKFNNNLDDTLILTFSEFGRRVKQNAGRGTDHGTANNLFLVGGQLRSPGLFNEMPDLTDLSDGDLKHKVDFRDVYASILTDWFATPHVLILGKERKLLNLV